MRVLKCGLQPVIINNSKSRRKVALHLKGLHIEGPVVGEYSAGEIRWEKIAPFVPDKHDRFSLDVDAECVITVSAPLRNLD